MTAVTVALPLNLLDYISSNRPIRLTIVGGPLVPTFMLSAQLALNLDLYYGIIAHLSFVEQCEIS